MYSVTLPPIKIRNGAKYVDLAVLDNTRSVASATIDKYSKLIYPENKFCIQIVWDSYKYEPEVQFGSFGVGKPIKKARGVGDSLYNRTESGFLPLSIATAEMLEDVAQKIRFFIAELGRDE